MHRGLIISVIQAVFSALFFYVAVPIYTGWLMVGYTTIYTMLPVFSLVLDEDVSAKIALLYPELYRDLQKGRALSIKSFLMWLWVSIYQGGVIMILAIALFEDSFINVVAITFTALMLCEWSNVALSIHRWNKWIAISLIVSIFAYAISVVVLKSYFDVAFMLTTNYVWKVAVISATAALPPVFIKWLGNKYNPAKHTKVNANARL